MGDAVEVPCGSGTESHSRGVPPIAAEVLRLLNSRLREELRIFVCRGERPDQELAEAIELEIYSLAERMPQSYQPTGRELARVLEDWIAWARAA